MGDVSPTLSAVWSANLSPTKNPFIETRAQLQRAEGLRLSGEIDGALAICQRLVSKYPRYMGALHTLGLLCVDKRDYPRALGFLVRAAMLNPRHVKTLTALGNVYLKLDAPEMAAQVLEAAERLSPQDPTILSALGEVYVVQREYELAVETLKRALERDPTLWVAEMRLGQCCVHLGQYAEAKAAMSKVAKRKPTPIVPLLWLSDLPRELVDANLLSRIDKATPNKNANKADFESSVSLARAAVLDKIGKYEEAWKNLVAGNEQIFSSRREEYANEFQLEQETLLSLRNDNFRIRRALGDGSNCVSLFIIGPSRSGKTTMEQLISTIDGVKRGYENPIAENAVRHAFQDAGFLTSEIYQHLPRELEDSCRDIYREELETRARSAAVFTNTHPGRVADAAQIAAILPNVRFIFIKRDIDDVMFRIYMKKYAAGFAFSYDLKAIRKHLNWNHNMIDILAQNLADISLVLRYEDMVGDPKGALRAAADLCGLSVGEAPLPAIGDDRGCAEPYRKLIAMSLSGR